MRWISFLPRLSARVPSAQSLVSQFRVFSGTLLVVQPLGSHSRASRVLSMQPTFRCLRPPSLSFLTPGTLFCLVASSAASSLACGIAFVRPLLSIAFKSDLFQFARLGACPRKKRPTSWHTGAETSQHAFRCSGPRLTSLRSAVFALKLSSHSPPSILRSFRPGTAFNAGRQPHFGPCVSFASQPSSGRFLAAFALPLATSRRATATFQGLWCRWAPSSTCQLRHLRRLDVASSNVPFLPLLWHSATALPDPRCQVPSGSLPFTIPRSSTISKGISSVDDAFVFFLGHSAEQWPSLPPSSSAPPSRLAQEGCPEALSLVRHALRVQDSSLLFHIAEKRRTHAAPRPGTPHSFVRAHLGSLLTLSQASSLEASLPRAHRIRASAWANDARARAERQRKPARRMLRHLR